MTTHNEKNINKLIAEFKWECDEKTPVTIWYDRNRKRYVTKDAIDRVNGEFNRNRRFDLVGTINLDTDHFVIREMIKSVERRNNYDCPIPTSMQNLTIEGDE